MPALTKNLLGQSIGRWTVVSYAGIIKNNSHWNCRCSCGTEKTVKAQYLLNGASTQCRKCGDKQDNIVAAMPTHYWRHIINNAQKRDIDLLLSREECYDLLVKQNFRCALSGQKLYMSKSSTEHNMGKTTASLDRIDSSKPYEQGNVQWVHKDVNRMKNIFTQEYFISMCKDIAHKSS